MALSSEKMEERANLMNVMKFSIKVLIQSALNLGSSLDSEYQPLKQFFLVIEHCLKHGLKVKKSFIGQNKSFFGPLELVEKLCPESSELFTNIRNLPEINEEPCQSNDTHCQDSRMLFRLITLRQNKTRQIDSSQFWSLLVSRWIRPTVFISICLSAVGRGRAWLHLAVMQKKLADYLQALIDHKHLLSEFYEQDALMMEEEGVVIVGLLVGLNMIDANLCLKGEDLDSQVGVIDFSFYLKDLQQNDNDKHADEIAAVRDQKHYLEELNRHLSCTVGDLQAKVESLEKANIKLNEELLATKDRVVSLQQEHDELLKENEQIRHKSERHAEVNKQDSKVELETYKQSRQGLDEMYNEVWKQLRVEKQSRLEMEKELELQVGLKAEMEIAMKLLEKDIHEKQDTLIVLRKQLDDVKTINLQMCRKVQDAETALNTKSEVLASNLVKIEQMVTAKKHIEERLQKSEKARQATEESCNKMKMEFGSKIDALQQELETQRKRFSIMEQDLILEREKSQNLKKDLQNEKDVSSSLRTELKNLSKLKRDFDALQLEKKQLRTRCDEQEQALQEMGLHLSQSKLKMEDIKEVNKALKGHTWLKDDEATGCKQCNKEFSISRRKHHCRNCGDIFCNTCSSNELSLPSYPKPVRVCDTCHNILLQRCSSNAS